MKKEAVLDEVKRLNRFNDDLLEENKRLHIKVENLSNDNAKSNNDIQMHITGYKEQETTFAGGAKRIVILECSHLICPELNRRVGLIYTEGLDSYPDKSVSHYAQISTARFGLPLDNLLRHLDNHYLRYRHGDNSEDNLAKIAWAIQQIMHQEDKNCQHYNLLLKPEDRTAKENTLYVG
jgi:hypothetical protein